MAVKKSDKPEIDLAKFDAASMPFDVKHLLGIVTVKPDPKDDTLTIPDVTLPIYRSKYKDTGPQIVQAYQTIPDIGREGFLHPITKQQFANLDHAVRWFFADVDPVKLQRSINLVSKSALDFVIEQQSKDAQEFIVKYNADNKDDLTTFDAKIVKAKLAYDDLYSTWIDRRELIRDKTKVKQVDHIVLVDGQIVINEGAFDLPSKAKSRLGLYLRDWTGPWTWTHNHDHLEDPIDYSADTIEGVEIDDLGYAPEGVNGYTVIASHPSLKDTDNGYVSSGNTLHNAHATCAEQVWQRAGLKGDLLDRSHGNSPDNYSVVKTGKIKVKDGTIIDDPKFVSDDTANDDTVDDSK